MTNQLQKPTEPHQSNQTLERPLISSLGQIVAVWARARERGAGQASDLRLISPERKRLEIEALESQLSPASPQTLKQATALVLSLPRSQGGDNVALATAYGIALDGCPGWAVSEAVKAWLKHDWPIKGEQPNFNFAPAPPVLRKLAAHFTIGHYQALDGIRACPTNAPEPEPEPGYVGGAEVDKILDKWRGMSKRKHDTKTTPETWERAAGNSDRLKAMTEQLRAKYDKEKS